MWGWGNHHRASNDDSKISFQENVPALMAHPVQVPYGLPTLYGKGTAVQERPPSLENAPVPKFSKMPPEPWGPSPAAKMYCPLAEEQIWRYISVIYSQTSTTNTNRSQSVSSRQASLNLKRACGQIRSWGPGWGAYSTTC